MPDDQTCIMGQRTIRIHRLILTVIGHRIKGRTSTSTITIPRRDELWPIATCAWVALGDDRTQTPAWSHDINGGEGDVPYKYDDSGNGVEDERDYGGHEEKWQARIGCP